MSNIQHIKPHYEPANVQKDLTHDGLKIMAMNITATFFIYNNRLMTQKEVDNSVKILYDNLVSENDLKNEWNQTS